MEDPKKVEDQSPENIEEQIVNEETPQDEIVEEELDEFGQLEKSNEMLKDELGQSKDKFLRMYAEFDNYKKRSAKERVELIATAGKGVILDFLPIIDDFERALKTNIDENEAEHNEGFTLIYQKSKRILESLGVVSMEAKGQTFDTDLHEAFSELDAGPENKGMVIDVIEQGYYLNDRIIRYAKVVVGK